ncbi:MAG: phage tail assembly protein [Chromatiales bacterium]|nr:phage tail assembly protein [Gammaproteobacteria bacterium]
MTQVTITLKHGLKIGEDCLKEVVIREATAGDIIEAQVESEQLVYALTDKGRTEPTLVTSPALMGINVLRRQIIKIGDVGGPFQLADIKSLHPEDLALLNAKAEELDGVITAEDASREVTQRGRSDSPGADDASAGDTPAASPSDAG